MTRGTTPTYMFTLPFDTRLVRAVQVIYSQNGAVVLQKNEKACVMDGKTVAVTLTQQDTFLFAAPSPVELQLRVLTSGGDALASPVYTVAVERCLNEDVMT